MNDTNDAVRAPAPSAPAFDLLAHLARQAEWSARTFGPGSRAQGVVDHIRKELTEIEADPGDLAEWIDVAILALDGAWRSGATPQQIIDALVAKQTRNEGRTWPDWRTADPNKAIEHDRSGEDPAPSEQVAASVAMPEWKVGRFSSSSRPGEIVLCLSVGPEQITRDEQHRSFIEWIANS